MIGTTSTAVAEVSVASVVAPLEAVAQEGLGRADIGYPLIRN